MHKERVPPLNSLCQVSQLSSQLLCMEQSSENWGLSSLRFRQLNCRSMNGRAAPACVVAKGCCFWNGPPMLPAYTTNLSTPYPSQQMLRDIGGTEQATRIHCLHFGTQKKPRRVFGKNKSTRSQIFFFFIPRRSCVGPRHLVIRLKPFSHTTTGVVFVIRLVGGPCLVLLQEGKSRMLRAVVLEPDSKHHPLKLRYRSMTVVTHK